MVAQFGNLVTPTATPKAGPGGTATITWPQFTWSQATPSAVTSQAGRLVNLGGLLGVNNAPSFSVALAGDTTVLSQSLTANTTRFEPVSASITPSKLVNGHTAGGLCRRARRGT